MCCSALAHDTRAATAALPFETTTYHKIPPSTKAFAVVSNNGATSHVHIDGDGWASAVLGEYGIKGFIVGTPIHPTLFSLNSRHRHSPTSIIYDMFWELVLVGPGITL